MFTQDLKMDHQQFILDNLKRILDVTDKSKAAELLKLVDEAGSTFIGGAGRSLLVSRFFCHAFGSLRLQRLHDR
jgi:DNA-binding MurR/RpiR family transcriptional regulator